MRALNTLGMNSVCLKTFYVSNIGSLLIYGAPAWYTILSDQCKEKLESTQRSATGVIFPYLAYREDRLELLVLPTLDDFIFRICKKHFYRICSSPDHPLCTRITINECKTSSQSMAIFGPAISKQGV